MLSVFIRDGARFRQTIDHASAKRWPLSSCYVETHDESYRGHFFLRRIELTQARLAIELDRPIDNLICVTFRLGVLEFEQASHVIRIISGEIEPDGE